MWQNLKHKSLPRMLQSKLFWREVACVPAFLNVIDVMTGTRRQLEMALQNVISRAKTAKNLA